jgi:hypothetical protein
MHRFKISLFAATLLPGLALAQASTCEYIPETTNPVTGEKIVATKWQRIKQGDGSGMSFTRGYVRAISEGDEKYLGIKNDYRSYSPIPPELGIRLEDTNMITRKGIYDPRLNAVVERLKQVPFALPVGSELRLTLEDRTTVTAMTSEEYSTLPEVLKPQHPPNSAPDFRLEYRVMPRYLLDADAIALLSNNLVVSLRMEFPNQYYYFGHRNLIWDDRVISKKTMATVQGVLKCVL